MGLFRKKPANKSNNNDIFSTNMDLADKTIANAKDNILDKFYTTEPIEASALLCLVTSRMFNKDAKTDLISKKEFTIGLELYIQIWLRKHGSFNPECLTTRYIAGMMLDKYGRLKDTDLDSILEATMMVITTIYTNEPNIKKRDQLYELLQNPAGFVLNNTVGNVINQHEYEGDEEWGLVDSKPVFVAGFGPDKEYLSHLHTEDGKKLSNIRNGSLKIDGIDGMIDKYTLYLDENPVGVIYLCNYGTTTPTKAPKGYKYI